MVKHKAIILAAGRGSRMGALTQDNPKCLIKLAGYPLLEWQIRSLRQAGIEDIAVVRGYKAESLDSYGQRHNLSFFKNDRWAESNMVTSLVEASTWLKNSPCIISYSDIFFSDLTVKALANSDQSLSISYDPQWQKLWSLRFENPLSDAETFKFDSLTGEIKEIGNKPSSYADIQGQYMGLLKFTPEGWSRIESYLASIRSSQQDKMSMTELLQNLIQNNIPIYAVPCQGIWGEADHQSDIELYEREFNIKWQ